MATIGTITGSKLIGSPITVPVTAASISGNPTFHRVRIITTINSTVKLESSQPVGEGEQVEFNISSALVAVASRYGYTAETVNSYPSFTVSIEAYDDYLLNGEERHLGPSTSVDGGTFFIGELTDRERMTGERPTLWTRKPFASSPEIVHRGKTLLLPGSFANNPSVQSISIGEQTQATSQYYPIDVPRDSYELRFVNTLGVHESSHITCLRTTNVNYRVEQFAIARQETLTRFSRGVSRKTDDYEVWRMNSGPLDEKWLQWWLHEPLKAVWAWMKVDGVWLPVHVLPEETVPGPDRTKAEALTVDFSLRFDINGSPFA